MQTASFILRHRGDFSRLLAAPEFDVEVTGGKIEYFFSYSEISVAIAIGAKRVTL